MKKLIFITVSLVLLLSSCFKERIDVNYNSENNKKVVIIAWLTDLDEAQYVSVGYTVSYLGEISEDPISNALVKISTTGEEYILDEQEKGKYHLPSDWKAMIGNEYHLQVEHDGKEYTASHLMRPCPNIDDPKFTPATDDNPFEEEVPKDKYETVFGFQELIGEGDAYYAVDYLKGSIAGDSLVNGQFANDEFVDGEYFDDIYISDYERLFEIGDTAVIELYSIGIETSNYLVDIESEIFRGGPFDPPPANVRSNIQGGALGYFIAAGAKQVSIIKQ